MEAITDVSSHVQHSAGHVSPFTLRAQQSSVSIYAVSQWTEIQHQGTLAH